MTSLDLRIKYKSETGCSPTQGRSGGPQISCNYKGELTYEYAVWLEGITRFSSRKRDRYSKDTGNQAVYYDYERNLYYNESYKEWLEEFMLKAYNEVEKLKK